MRIKDIDGNPVLYFGTQENLSIPFFLFHDVSGCFFTYMALLYKTYMIQKSIPGRRGTMFLKYFYYKINSRKIFQQHFKYLPFSSKFFITVYRTIPLCPMMNNCQHKYVLPVNINSHDIRRMAAIQILPILRLKQQHRFNIFCDCFFSFFVDYFFFYFCVGYSQRVFYDV